MKKFISILLAITTVFTLASCGVSKDEKEMRRSNAFDIEGRYDLDNSSTFLTIKNESDRSNVYGTIERTNFSDEEVKAFDRQQISINDVEKFRTKFILGIGSHRWLDGGENISDDFGKTSKLYIATSFNESATLANGLYVDYAISASVSKLDFVLRGKIIMTIEKSIQSQTTTEYKILESVEIPFSATNNTIFANQYMGNWTGIIVADNSALNSQFSTINLRKIDENNYEVFAANSTFVLNGETFKQIKKNESIDQLAKTDYPEITLEYIGNSGSKIEVLGNIYALGMYIGVITKIDSNKNVEQIGNFQYKRL